MEVKKKYKFNPDKDLIGQGGFGSVYKAIDENLGMEVALKKFTASKLPTKYSLFEEIKRVIKLSHPNLVRYYDAFELEGANTFGDTIQVGVMEFINGGDLINVLRTKPNQNTLKNILIGVMDGLKYLHSKGIIHRDIKPENILIQVENDGLFTPKITDFGISKVLNEHGTSGSSLIIGSIEYMAPEQFNPQRYGINNQLHTNLDIWSLGVIIVECFTGTPPFGKTMQGISRDEIMRNILDKDIANQLHHIPAPFDEVARKCLIRNANQRAKSIDELFAIIEQNDNAPVATATHNFNNLNIGSNQEFNTTAIPKNILQNTAENLNTTSANVLKTVTPPQNTVVKNLIPTIEKSTLPKTAITSIVGFRPSHILPLVSAAVAYLFCNSLKTIFGYQTPVGDYYQYAIFLCCFLLVVNILWAVFKRPKLSDAAAYNIAFFVLFFQAFRWYFLYREYIFTQAKMYFKAANHPIIKFLPWVALLSTSIIAAFRIKAMIDKREVRWFEMILLMISYIVILLSM